MNEQTLTEMKNNIPKGRPSSQGACSRMAAQPRQESEENEATELMFGYWPEPIPITATTKRNKLFLKCRVCTKNKKY